jgi:hypothetical protein
VQKKTSEIVSTIGIECEMINVAGGEIMVWDFAGQEEYTATHQFFLSNEVFYLLDDISKAAYINIIFSWSFILCAATLVCHQQKDEINLHIGWTSLCHLLLYLPPQA